MTRRARGEGAVLGAGGQRRLWLYVSTYKSLNEMKTLGECQKLIPWVGARGRGIVHTKVQCSVGAHAQWAGGWPVSGQPVCTQSATFVTLYTAFTPRAVRRQLQGEAIIFTS